MKTCRKCGEAKPLSEFYTDTTTRDGFRWKCKSCFKLACKKWRALNPDRVLAKVYEWRSKNYGRWREYRSKMSYKQRYTHPDQAAAQSAIAYSIKKGSMIPLCCEICGDPNTEGHHYNYSHVFRIQWLCRKHHYQANRLNT